MAFHVLTVEWQGLPGNDGALEGANKRDDLAERRNELRRILLQADTHPDRLSDPNFQNVGSIGNSGGDHIPGSSNICWAEVIFDDECLGPRQAVEALRELMQQIFGDKSLRLTTRAIEPGDEGYEWLFVN